MGVARGSGYGDDPLLENIFEISCGNPLHINKSLKFTVKIRHFLENLLCPIFSSLQVKGQLAATMEYPDESFANYTTSNRRSDPITVIYRSAIAMVVLGVVMFILGAAAIRFGLIGLTEPRYSGLAAGIWCGVVVFAAGFIGLFAVRRQTQAWNVWSMIMACGGILCSVIFLIISSASLNAVLNPMGQNTTAIPDSFATQNATLTPNQNDNIGISVVDSFAIIIALATLITAITQAISSYQREPFGLPTLIFVMGRTLLGCCCKKALEEQTTGIAREEDFSPDEY
jgi:hypothetical protein